MDNDTDLGGPAAQFPATHCSIVRATGATDPSVRQRAFADLISTYWKPVYKYIRVKWSHSNEDAKDLTQGFFARAYEKDFFASFDPAQARFRTFLRTCVDAFVAKAARDGSRLKRGGDQRLLSLDFAGADEELRRYSPAARMDLEDFFRQEWVRGLFGLALDDLRQHCVVAGKETHFALFQRYDLEGPDAGQAATYAELAQEFGLPVTQVTNYLAFARRQFRAFVLERLRASTGSEDEFLQESRRLFGGEAP